jgi:hypothetical protein
MFVAGNRILRSAFFIAEKKVKNERLALKIMTCYGLELFM